MSRFGLHLGVCGTLFKNGPNSFENILKLLYQNIPNINIFSLMNEEKKRRRKKPRVSRDSSNGNQG